ARYPNAEITYVEGTGWVAPPLEDVPDAAFCVDAACAQSGIVQAEFDNLRLEGTAVKTTTEKAVTFRWGWPDRQQRDTTIRWSGYLKAGESGAYGFRF